MTVMSGVVSRAVSIGANYTSNWINVREFSCFAMQFWLTGAGTANGSLSFEASCEDDPTLATTTNDPIIANYVTHPVALTSPAAVTITSGSPSSGLVQFTDVGYKWVRVKYTFTSGTGTLDVRISAKGGIP